MLADIFPFSNQPIVGLAPMDGITNQPFRQLLARISSPDCFFTEFVSAEGLTRGGVKLFDHLLYCSNERPIFAQLFGKDPDSFYRAAIILSALGFNGIDLNMGCPAKTVINHGSGAALIGHPALAAEIINAASQGINDWYSKKININQLKLPSKTISVIKRNQLFSQPLIIKYKPILSTKTRLGLKESTISRWIPFLSKLPLDLIILHGRTLSQGYSGLASWDAIFQAGQILKGSSISLWGNGDLQNRSQAIEYCQRYQISGALIGRAALGNPWVFSTHQPTPLDRFNSMVLYTQIFSDTFPQTPIDSLRRYYLEAVKGLPCAKQLRLRLVKVTKLQQLLALEADILNC